MGRRQKHVKVSLQAIEVRYTKIPFLSSAIKTLGSNVKSGYRT